MNKSFAVFSLLGALFLSPVTGSSAEPAPIYQKRDFRPIQPVKKARIKQVAIKQNVKGGLGLMKQQSIKVVIPPPPIPSAEESLFPADSVPDVDLSIPPTPTFNEVDEVTLPPIAEEEEGQEELQLGSDSNEPQDEEIAPTDGELRLSLSCLRNEAHKLAQEGLCYSFGADDPETGGLDCSGVVQYLLNKLGVDDVPRTSYDQYDWLKHEKTLDDVYGKNSTKKLFKKLSPGDLIFWGGTWDSGHRVSHVMIYMGYDKAVDKHYVFGARSKSSKGMFGNGVDIFELEPDRGRLIACGKIPGLIYD